MKRYSATLTVNATLTIDLSDDQDIELLLIQDATGNRTVTWTGVGAWLTPSGSAPTLQTTGGASDLVTFFQTGGIVYGVHAGEAGAAGATGAAGPAWNQWKGAYSAGTTYAIGDAVYLSGTGSSYIALLAGAGNAPDLTTGTFWAVLCQGGTVTTGGSNDFIDNFTRADIASIAAQTVPPAPWTYTGISQTGGWSSGSTGLGITTNLLTDGDVAGNRPLYRAGQVMPSADHHAQVTLGAVQLAGTSVQYVVCCRFAAAAGTAYVAVAGSGNASTLSTWTITLYKLVAGVYTQLIVSPAFSTLGLVLPKAGDKLNLSVGGTAIAATWNGTPVVSTTDSSITTGTQAGFGMLLLGGSVAGNKYSEFRFGT